MSTLATVDLGASDDEGDTDFVPEARKPKGPKTKRSRDDESDSSDSDDDGEEDTDEIKRLKAEAEEAAAAERKKRAAEAFRLMQEEAKNGPSSPAPVVKEVEMVEIKRPRRFAGETIFETVRLPKDHPDAIKYLAGESGENGTASVEVAADSKAESASSPASAPSSAPSSSSLPPRRPIRKRPRQSLEAMAAAIDKGKKMSTLEKSQMDWSSHMGTEKKLADEVAQHRRSGGFLEKQAFLDRVGERRDALGEGGTGRRR